MDRNRWTKLTIDITEDDRNKLIQAGLTDDLIHELAEVIREDPRPQYQDDKEKVYGMSFAGHDIHFVVDSGKATLIW